MITDDERREEMTAELSQKVAAKLRREFAIVAQEVWVDSRHRVDFVAFSPGIGGRNCALEHGLFRVRVHCAMPTGCNVLP